MSNHLQKAALFVKQQHDWLVDLQYVLSEKEQKYKVLYNKLNYQLKNELQNERLEANAGRKNELIGYEHLEDNHSHADDDILSDVTEYSDDVNRTVEKAKSSLNRNFLEPEETPYKCSYCGKLCKQKSNLVQHERVHTGERPFGCEECGKRFKSKMSLHRHYGMHVRKPYKCSYCGRPFKQKSIFEDHERMHTGEKPFDCDVCRRKFRTAKNLKNHYQFHSKEKPFSCEICPNSKFTLMRNLIRHMRIYHTA